MNPRRQLATLQSSIQGSLIILKSLAERFPPMEGGSESADSAGREEPLSVKALDVATQLASHEVAQLWARAHRSPAD